MVDWCVLNCKRTVSVHAASYNENRLIKSLNHEPQSRLWVKKKIKQSCSGPQGSVLWTESRVLPLLLIKARCFTRPWSIPVGSIIDHLHWCRAQSRCPRPRTARSGSCPSGGTVHCCPGSPWRPPPASCLPAPGVCPPQREVLVSSKLKQQLLCAGRDNKSKSSRNKSGWFRREHVNASSVEFRLKKCRCCCCRSSPLWFLCLFPKSSSVLFSVLLLFLSSSWSPDTQECVGGVKLARRQETTGKMPKNVNKHKFNYPSDRDYTRKIS